MALRLAGDLPANATWDDFSGPDESAHFYHANGFPPLVYQPLLSRLQRTFSLRALRMRATWPQMGPPPRQRDWRQYAQDLIDFIENKCSPPVFGIGHSMGATCTVLAAERRPDLFRALVLIEPAMVSRMQATVARLLPKSLMNLTEPAKATLRKPDSWASRDEYLTHCRRFKGYKRFGPDALEALANHGVADLQDGRVKLAFPKAWEAHNYTQPPHAMANIARLTTPCVAIRGRPSPFFSEALWQEWKAVSPRTVFLEDQSYGHLLPLEAPDVCCTLIVRGLASIRTQER